MLHRRGTASADTYQPPPAGLRLLSWDWQQRDFNRYIVGSVVNGTGRRLRYAQVTFSLYDGSGARVGSAMDNINDLDPGAVWNFKAIVFEWTASKAKPGSLSGF